MDMSNKKIFNVQSFLGNDIEKYDRIEESEDLDSVVVKEEVLNDMLENITLQLILRKIKGYPVSDEILEVLIKHLNISTVNQNEEEELVKND